MTEIARHTLDNGLRCLVVPDPGVAVSAVVVEVATGFRHERPGTGGFAHLFEHLMSQGSANLEKLEHKKLIDAAGGWYSGSTRADHTQYTTTIPSAALELSLWCEADRLEALRITEEAVCNQVAVVGEEIAVNIHDRPGGGFPWFDLDAALFDRWENSHDGYGGMEDLRTASVEAAQRFFHEEYTTENTVVCIAGGVDSTTGMDLLMRYFSGIPGRSAPPRTSAAELPLAGDRRVRRGDPRLPRPLVAVGWHAPDPGEDWDDYVALRVACALLTGPSGLLRRRLVDDAAVAVEVGWTMGSLGDWSGTSGPTPMGFTADCAGSPEDAVAAIDATLSEVAEGAVDGEVAGAARRLAVGLWRHADDVEGRGVYAAQGECLARNPGRLDTLPSRVAAIDAAAVRKAVTTWLLDRRRAVVEVTP